MDQASLLAMRFLDTLAFLKKHFKHSNQGRLEHAFSCSSVARIVVKVGRAQSMMGLSRRGGLSGNMAGQLSSQRTRHLHKLASALWHSTRLYALCTEPGVEFALHCGCTAFELRGGGLCQEWGQGENPESQARDCSLSSAVLLVHGITSQLSTLLFAVTPGIPQQANVVPRQHKGLSALLHHTMTSYHIMI